MTLPLHVTTGQSKTKLDAKSGMKKESRQHQKSSETDTRNEKGGIIGFGRMNKPKIMSTFFLKTAARKLIREPLKGEIKNGNPVTLRVKNEAAMCKVWRVKYKVVYGFSKLDWVIPVAEI